MKKIFVLTGETSGDKLASKIITELKIQDQILNIYL
jgi:lipid A disaccharide synthetase